MYPLRQSPFDIPLHVWLLYAYVIAAPFFVFSVVTGRDTFSNWVVGLMFVVMCLDVIQMRGSIAWDKSLSLLLIVLFVYGISTIVTLSQDSNLVWAYRTPAQRALGVTLRILIVVFTYMVFIHYLAIIDRDLYKKILHLQISIGVVLALLGLFQSIAHAVTNSVIRLEPTNEAFALRSNIFRIGKEQVFRASSAFSEPSYFGFFLVPVAVKAALTFRNRLYLFDSRQAHLATSMILLVALIANFSLTALGVLGFLITVSVVLSVRKSPRLAGATALVGILTLVAMALSPLGELFVSRISRAVELRDLSTLARLFSGYVGIQVFIENPLFGVGPGGFAFHYARLGILVDPGQMHTPLNVWISILTDVGLLGFLPFIGALVFVLHRGLLGAKRDPLVSVFFWSVIAYLLLLTTVDLWYLDIVWFEIASLAILAQRALPKS
ncbi:MAG: hypothetical protein C4326_13230 [Ignavibacteria bacterium]